MELCAHGISYSYPDGTKAIENVSLCVYSGEIVCLLGPNGSGKSTLLLLLAGLLKPNSGSVTLNGKDIEELNYRRICGILFQNPWDQLIAPTVWEDVSLGLRQLGLSGSEIKARVEAVLEEFGLAGFEERSPFKLSGGEAARVALAGLVALDPEVYLLDEPTSSLDYVGMEALKRLLRGLKERGKIVVIATQDSDFVFELADKVYLINEGKLMYGGDLRVLSEIRLEDIGVRVPVALKLYKKLLNCLSNSGDPISTLREILSSNGD